MHLYRVLVPQSRSQGLHGSRSAGFASSPPSFSIAHSHTRAKCLMLSISIRLSAAWPSICPISQPPHTYYQCKNLSYSVCCRPSTQTMNILEKRIRHEFDGLLKLKCPQVCCDLSIIPRYFHVTYYGSETDWIVHANSWPPERTNVNI